jgi:PKD repeat protein
VATTAAAPVASFTATPVIGTAPLTVNFASTSTGSIATYAWSFGDGTTSSAQNPSKVYSTSGSFTVSLTVTGSGGSHTATQTNFIAVSAPNAALVLVGVLVDRTAAPGTVSNVNGILEPGETVLIAPMWELTAGGSVTVSASAQVSGQGSSAFALGDRAASYGSLTIGQVVDCESATGNCYRLTVSEGVRRPTLKWGINFTETLSTGTVVTRTIPIGKSFADVPTNDMFYAQIEAMAWNDVTYGYDDGTYKPGLGVSRWQTAMFLARASVKAEGIAAFPVSGIIGTKPYNCVAGGVSVYTDVSPTDPGCQAFHYLASRQTNLSSECGASTLVCPDRATTRAAMAVEVAGTIAAGGDAGIPAVATFNDTGTARSYNCATTGGSHFTDVPSSAGFCRHVNYLWARGIVDGYGGGIFHPEVSLTRGQMAKFVTNAFRLSME